MSLAPPPRSASVHQSFGMAIKGLNIIFRSHVKLHSIYDWKRRRPDRVKKSFDLIPIDLFTDFRFASRIL